LHMRNALTFIKHILTIALVILSTANPSYASHQHASPECYLKGHRIYVPSGFNYPRQAWASWGISCPTPKLGGGTVADSAGRPLEWCGWWMRQHLGGHYGPEFNVARNWLNAGRPLDAPRPGVIGVKPHHVFQVVQVIDRGHVLAISGNDHNAVLTRIRPTSDVIGWRDVSEDAAAEKLPSERTVLQKPARAEMRGIQSGQSTTKHFAIKDTVGNCSVIDFLPSRASGMQLLGNKNGYASIRDAQGAFDSNCKAKIQRA
jgi:hypothetical protein